MRQDQLTKEGQKCDHGLFFGTTCEKCEVERLKAEVAMLKGLAYIGDHHFPDLTWKARAEELVTDLRLKETLNTRLQGEVEALTGSRSRAYWCERVKTLKDENTRLLRSGGIRFTAAELGAVTRLVNIEVQHGNSGPDATPEAKADGRALGRALAKLQAATSDNARQPAQLVVCDWKRTPHVEDEGGPGHAICLHPVPVPVSAQEETLRNPAGGAAAKPYRYGSGAPCVDEIERDQRTTKGKA